MVIRAKGLTFLSRIFENKISRLWKQIEKKPIPDPSMVKDGDLGGDGVCLRIGYLNRQIDQNLPVYRDLYDLVLVEDETLGIPLCLINQLF